MGDWNSLDAIKHRQQQDAATAAAVESGGWVEESGGPGVRHHVMAVGVLGLAAYAYQNRAYLQRLGNRWWNGCAPAFPSGSGAGATAGGAGARRPLPAIRQPLLPPTVQLKVKRVGGEAAVIGASLDDTVQEMISRIETQLDVAVQNLLFAGEILTLFRSQSLAEGNVRDGSTLVYTIRQPSQEADGGTTGLAGRARGLIDEMSSGPSVVSRVAGPAQLATPPGGPKATRCCFCNAKLPPLATALQCRCEGVFCEVHRPPHAHECTYDPQQAARRRLRESLREANLPAAGEAEAEAVAGASEAERYTTVYMTEHPELERGTRTGHTVALGIGAWYGFWAFWSLSVWTLIQGMFYSALAAKGSHAWQRWSSVSRPTSQIHLYCRLIATATKSKSNDEHVAGLLISLGLDCNEYLSQEGRVDCTCKHCLWSVEGAR